MSAMQFPLSRRFDFANLAGTVGGEASDAVRSRIEEILANPSPLIAQIRRDVAEVEPEEADPDNKEWLARTPILVEDHPEGRIVANILRVGRMGRKNIRWEGLTQVALHVEHVQA